MQIEIKEFGANLYKIRKARKMTLADVGHRAEMDSRHVSKIEKGLLDIQLSTVIRLMRAVEAEANDLFPRR